MSSTTLYWASWMLPSFCLHVKVFLEYLTDKYAFQLVQIWDNKQMTNFLDKAFAMTLFFPFMYSISKSKSCTLPNSIVSHSNSTFPGSISDYCDWYKQQTWHLTDVFETWSGCAWWPTFPYHRRSIITRHVCASDSKMLLSVDTTWTRYQCLL